MSNGEDPWGEGEENCDAFYYAAQDANYNPSTGSGP